MGVAERWKGFRELPPDIGEALERLGPLFQREGVALAYLFGSLAKGHKAHDVDIAVLMQREPAYRLRGKISGCLGTERLDLVDLSQSSPLLRYEIVRTGRCVYARDKEALNRFELETIHLYRDTAYLRRNQEAVLRRRVSRWSTTEA